MSRKSPTPVSLTINVCDYCHYFQSYLMASVEAAREITPSMVSASRSGKWESGSAQWRPHYGDQAEALAVAPIL
jgi:hypothetical protein